MRIRNSAERAQRLEFVGGKKETAMSDKQIKTLELFADCIVDEGQEKYVPQMAKLKEQTLPELPNKTPVQWRSYDDEDLFNIAADIVNKSLEYKVKEATREGLLRSKFEKSLRRLEREWYRFGSVEDRKRYNTAIKEMLEYDTKLDNELPLGEITAEYKGNKLVISSSGENANLKVCGVDFSLTDRQRNLYSHRLKEMIEIRQNHIDSALRAIGERVIDDLTWSDISFRNAKHWFMDKKELLGWTRFSIRHDIADSIIKKYITSRSRCKIKKEVLIDKPVIEYGPDWYYDDDMMILRERRGKEKVKAKIEISLYKNVFDYAIRTKYDNYTIDPEHYKGSYIAINGIKYNLTSKTAGELYNLIDNVRTDRKQKEQQQKTRINGIHSQNVEIAKENEVISGENAAVAAYKKKYMKDTDENVALKAAEQKYIEATGDNKASAIEQWRNRKQINKR
jgi:hypothetical protein